MSCNFRQLGWDFAQSHWSGYKRRRLPASIQGFGSTGPCGRPLHGAPCRILIDGDEGLARQCPEVKRLACGKRQGRHLEAPYLDKDHRISDPPYSPHSRLT